MPNFKSPLFPGAAMLAVLFLSGCTERVRPPRKLVRRGGLVLREYHSSAEPIPRKQTRRVLTCRSAIASWQPIQSGNEGLFRGGMDNDY